MFFPTKKAVLGVFALAFTLAAGVPVSQPTRANVLDDITDAVVGHTRDILGRLGNDEVLADAKVLLSGRFRKDDPGNDLAHHGSGGVSLIEKDGTYYVQFQPDFASAFAPDPTIYVSSADRVFDATSFARSERQKLGKLSKASGASYVKVVGFDPKRIKSVTIWCERFSAFITSASLE